MQRVMILSQLRLWQWIVWLAKDWDVDGEVIVGSECAEVDYGKHGLGNLSRALKSETDEGMCIDVNLSGSSSVPMEEFPYYEVNTSDLSNLVSVKRF